MTIGAKDNQIGNAHDVLLPGFRRAR